MMNPKQQKVLIVEDEPALLKIYVERFSEEGFLVLKATNGQEGLEVALREKPDLILLDVMMPVMDGLTMTSLLRKNKTWGKTVPIIFLTNLSANRESIMKIIAENKPAYYVSKSAFSLQAIVEKIREQLV